MATSQTGFAAWDGKAWLPRRFARRAIAAAIEFHHLLDIQPPGILRDSDGEGDARHGNRHRSAMVLLLTAMKASLTTPPRPRPEWRVTDIAGIFALLAAEEFKYLLDVQPPLSLFYPSTASKGRLDARQSATYAHATALIDNLRLNLMQVTAGHGSALADTSAVGCVVPNLAADSPANVLKLDADVEAALLSLGFEFVDKGCGSSEHGRLFEGRLSINSQIDEVLKPANGQGDAVHVTVPRKVDEQPLCHGAADNQGAR